MDSITKTLTSDMFVIRHRYVKDGIFEYAYRATKYDDGRTTRYETEKISEADMFKTKETALDHAIFTITDLISEGDILTVIPIQIIQTTETHYHQTTGEEVEVMK